MQKTFDLTAVCELSLQEIVTLIVRETAFGTSFNADGFINNLLPIPDHSQAREVLLWLDRFVLKAEGLSLEHLRVAQRCHSSIVAVLKIILRTQREEPTCSVSVNQEIASQQTLGVV
jgi:hypothetical protein